MLKNAVRTIGNLIDKQSVSFISPAGGANSDEAARLEGIGQGGW
ncbi:UDP-N-acetylglucosamine pyrophosphorylase [Syntrophobotulus glycolicus DSM 8271]|uniref:UDP-N-acetylglucosamine pyrophosphorylase n=1 Tax=Syntrophobotulus glycolicus (strain DSM 8271 / FlGlyR) TaxID=645991 RepID=F0T2G9_SYNGF|nr:hypothetical protein [Syntrophobotulus glycolicus]ADY55287.1 UDP-N-acetylglucosamine pyrophosphorylase [Syntrophobotulus glycolicus DSM 8271]